MFSPWFYVKIQPTNKSDDNGSLCVAPELRGNAFSFLLLNMMLAMCLSYMTLLCWEMFPLWLLSGEFFCFNQKWNGAGRIMLPDLRLYFRARVIKTMWYRHNNRCTDKGNKIESPEINPCTYGQSTTKEARIYSGEKTVSLINCAGKSGQPHVKEWS